MFKNIQKTGLVALAIGALGVGAGAVADAASTGTSGASGTTGATGAKTVKHGKRGARRGGVPRQRSDETVQTGDNAAKLKAAALEKVPGATVIKVETDGDGAAYEAHLRKADGTLVTVKFNAQFEATGVEAGMGAGGPGGPPPGGANG